MENDEIILKLTSVINKGANRITTDDKTFIKSAAAEWGVVIASGNCKSCYIDAAVEIVAIIKKTHQETTTKYELKDGVDVWFGNVRVNAATLTDTLAAKLIKRGLSLDYFAKYDNNKKNGVE